jgi:hypothetical protein
LLSKLNLQRALSDSLNKMHGWASSGETGIRHGADPGAKHKPDINDARLTLVWTSAVLNYLMVSEE